jgi:hypothetical protein
MTVTIGVVIILIAGAILTTLGIRVGNKRAARYTEFQDLKKQRAEKLARLRAAANCLAREVSHDVPYRDTNLIRSDASLIVLYEKDLQTIERKLFQFGRI